MSIGGFIGALGDAFGGYAQAQAGEERRKQIADELKFKYANLNEGIADRQARGTEAIAGRKAIADENAASRLATRQLSVDERTFQANLQAKTAASQQAISDAYNQGRLTEAQARLAYEKLRDDANRVSAERRARISAGSRNSQSSAGIRLLQLQQRAAATGMSQAEREANDLVARNFGVEPQNPGAFDPAVQNTPALVEQYYGQLRKYAPLDKILKKRQTYSDQHARLSESLQQQMAGMLGNPPIPDEQENDMTGSSGSPPDAMDPDFIKSLTKRPYP